MAKRMRMQATKKQMSVLVTEIFQLGTAGAKTDNIMKPHQEEEHPREDPRAWLKSTVSDAAGGQLRQPKPATKSTAKHVTHGLTATMARPDEFQNMLVAVPHPHAKTGYKSAADPCNRSDKHNGGEFQRFASAYSSDFCSVDDKPIQFRKDGLPISARRVPNKPLMAPKLPNAADRSFAKRLFKKYNHQSSIVIGNPAAVDSKQFKSVYAMVHAAPHRQLGQPNPGIVAEDAARTRMFR